MTRYFIDAQDNYIGAFDGAEPPPGSIEVPEPPPLHAQQKRIGNGWGPPPAPIDFSDLDNLDRAFKAFGLLLRQYANELKAGTYAGTGPGGTKTVAEAKADFKAVYQALP